MPEALRSLVWESVPDISDYASVVDRVVAAIHGNREKPALGNPPSYLAERPIPGLHSADTRVLRVIYQDAVERNRPHWSPEEFSSALGGLPQEALFDSLEILEQNGYIKIKRMIGGLPRGIGVIQPTLNGFMVFARVNLPEIELMMQKIALTILNEEIESASRITEATQIAPFIVDNLLDLFASRGWVKVSNTLADKHVFSVSPSMKRAFA